MPADSNVILRGDKSFVYDLDVQRGIVSSRVALLLRSAEVKPLLSDLLLFFFIPYGRGTWEAGGREQEGLWVVPTLQVCGMCLSCGTLWHYLALVWLTLKGKGLFKACKFP